MTLERGGQGSSLLSAMTCYYTEEATASFVCFVARKISGENFFFFFKMQIP